MKDKGHDYKNEKSRRCQVPPWEQPAPSLWASFGHGEMGKMAEGPKEGMTRGLYGQQKMGPRSSS